MNRTRDNIVSAFALVVYLTICLGVSAVYFSLAKPIEWVFALYLWAKKRANIGQSV